MDSNRCMSHIQFVLSLLNLQDQRLLDAERKLDEFAKGTSIQTVGLSAVGVGHMLLDIVGSLIAWNSICQAIPKA